MTNDIKTWILVGAVALLSLLACIQYFGGKAATVNYHSDIVRLEDENNRLEKFLADSQGQLDRIREGLTASTEQIADISSGVGDGLDAIDASLGIAEELSRLIRELEEILGGG